MSGDGLQIIAVDVSNDVPRSRQFYEEFGFTIPAAMDEGQRVSGATYGVIGTPTNYLIDASGRIVWRHYGYRRGDDVEIRARVAALLAADRR